MIVDWATANNLKLNTNKIKAMIFRTVFELNHLDKIYNSDIPPIIVSNVTITYSASVINLRRVSETSTEK